ncbi:Zinc finger, FYVE/PHD-type [Pseudocohnilembus persalinus]|uniref:Zinc finger, FYVE/PHD-type n=1 Tax=Pseudocohnilembus persalinus TaxID=266149 RepID=A0A0V0QJ93_PSEPJ|nr:Zinc finger, FYVE/PHD-type [Pseudocohnilembus persalinus]|eukprot:KRX02308.1 Zinc finger, FYVE/PHD-type [Pseudocohnilembus persalinus]
MKRSLEEAVQSSEQEETSKQQKLNSGNGKKQQAPKDLEQIVKKCITEKKYEDMVKACSLNPEIYKEYRKLKFKQTIYKLDGTLLISNGDDPDNDYIGKLKKIIRIDFEQVHTLIQLQWYYKKSDIDSKYNNQKQNFSENEVFLTEHTDYALVDCINGKCDIITYDEYDQLSSIPANTFYSRAEYNAAKKKFNPPLEKWKKGCICNVPLNPDLLYVQCDKCSNWIHITCAGLTSEQVETIENYECKNCKK